MACERRWRHPAGRWVGEPALCERGDINLDAEFAPHMLYVTNEDKPGFIGRLGTLLGAPGVALGELLELIHDVVAVLVVVIVRARDAGEQHGHRRRDRSRSHNRLDRHEDCSGWGGTGASL